ERGVDGRDLGEDVDAVAVVVDHLLDPAHLPLDPVQTFDHRRLVGVVAVDGLGLGFAHRVAPSRVLWKLRRRRLLLTTKTLEKAIAAAAMIGLSRPATASGIAATL